MSANMGWIIWLLICALGIVGGRKAIKWSDARQHRLQLARAAAYVEEQARPTLFEPSNDFERWLLAPGDETLADFLWRLDNEKKAIRRQLETEKSVKVAQLKLAHQASKFDLATILTNGVRMPPWAKSWWRDEANGALNVVCRCNAQFAVKDTESLTGRLAEHWTRCATARGEHLYA